MPGGDGRSPGKFLFHSGGFAVRLRPQWISKHPAANFLFCRSMGPVGSSHNDELSETVYRTFYLGAQREGGRKAAEVRSSLGNETRFSGFYRLRYGRAMAG